MRRKLTKIIPIVLLVLIAAAIIADSAPKLRRDTAIRQNGEVFYTKVLGMSGSIPWVYFHVEAPEGMRCGLWTWDHETSADIYCLRAVRNLLGWGNYSQWAPFHLIGEMIEVVYYDGNLLYADSNERTRLTANIVFAVFLLGIAGWILFRMWKSESGEQNEQ